MTSCPRSALLAERRMRREPDGGLEDLADDATRALLSEADLCALAGEEIAKLPVRELARLLTMNPNPTADISREVADAVPANPAAAEALEACKLEPHETLAWARVLLSRPGETPYDRTRLALWTTTGMHGRAIETALGGEQDAAHGVTSQAARDTLHAALSAYPDDEPVVTQAATLRGPWPTETPLVRRLLDIYDRQPALRARVDEALASNSAQIAFAHQLETIRQHEHLPLNASVAALLAARSTRTTPGTFERVATRIDRATADDPVQLYSYDRDEPVQLAEIRPDVCWHALIAAADRDAIVGDGGHPLDVAVDADAALAALRERSEGHARAPGFEPFTVGLWWLEQLHPLTTVTDEQLATLLSPRWAAPKDVWLELLGVGSFRWNTPVVAQTVAFLQTGDVTFVRDDSRSEVIEVLARARMRASDSERLDTALTQLADPARYFPPRITQGVITWLRSAGVLRRQVQDHLCWLVLRGGPSYATLLEQAEISTFDLDLVAKMVRARPMPEQVREELVAAALHAVAELDVGDELFEAPSLLDADCDASGPVNTALDEAARRLLIAVQLEPDPDSALAAVPSDSEDGWRKMQRAFVRAAELADPVEACQMTGLLLNHVRALRAEGRHLDAAVWSPVLARLAYRMPLADIGGLERRSVLVCELLDDADGPQVWASVATMLDDFDGTAGALVDAVRQLHLLGTGDNEPFGEGTR